MARKGMSRRELGGCESLSAKGRTINQEDVIMKKSQLILSSLAAARGARGSCCSRGAHGGTGGGRPVVSVADVGETLSLENVLAARRGC